MIWTLLGILCFVHWAGGVVFEYGLLGLRREVLDKKRREVLMEKDVILGKIIKHADRIAVFLFALKEFCLMGAVGFSVMGLLGMLSEGERWERVVLVVLVGFYLLILLLDRLIECWLSEREDVWESKLKGLWRYYYGLFFVMRPVIFVVHFLIAKLTRLVGKGERLDSEDIWLQLRAMGIKEMSLPTEILRILRNGVKMVELEVVDVMLPRMEIEYMDIEDGVEANLKKAKASGYTRFPLCRGGIDHCLGIIHIKDVFHYEGAIEQLNLKELHRRLVKFHEQTRLEVALRKLLKYRVHMGLIYDEFGSVVGLITLDHILEKLVGEIQDEFDEDEAEEIVKLGEGVYKVLGLASIEEVNGVMEVELKNDDVTTIGGLVAAEFGRIPEKGEVIRIGRVEVTVNEVTKKRVVSLLMKVVEVE